MIYHARSPAPGQWHDEAHQLDDALRHEGTTTEAKERWLGPGVAGIGTASFLADVGHEIPTALPPSLLTATLGLIEGLSDGLAGAAWLAGGPSPMTLSAAAPRRRRLHHHRGALHPHWPATSVWQVGILRAGAWAARGLRVPACNALLADIVAKGLPVGRGPRRERVQAHV